MLAAGLIVFREMLEAALVISIVLAATRGVTGSRLFITGGAITGLAGAFLLALFAESLSDAMNGMGQEVFNAGVLAVAVLMLGWHTVWMSRHGREMAAEMRAVGSAVSAGSRPLSVLSVVVGVAVLREGAETVLFLYGILASDGDSLLVTVAGAGLGLVAGAAVGALLYAGLLAIPTRLLFGVTSWMVMLLAAGMAAQSVTFLSAAGVIDVNMDPVWDSSALLSEDSLPGRLLHTLIGYIDHPAWPQIIAYALTLAVIAGAARLVSRQTVRPAA